MKLLELIDIEWRIKDLLKEINAPEHLVPDFLDDERNSRDSQPFLMYDNHIYTYCVIERGRKVKEQKTLDCDEAVFWALTHVTFSLAFTYAAKFGQNKEQRIDGFEKQIELLVQIKIQDVFIAKLKNEYNEILGYKLFL